MGKYTDVLMSQDGSTLTYMEGDKIAVRKHYANSLDVPEGNIVDVNGKVTAGLACIILNLTERIEELERDKFFRTGGN